jgi:O-succinylbenzoate synthase
LFDGRLADHEDGESVVGRRPSVADGPCGAYVSVVTDDADAPDWVEIRHLRLPMVAPFRTAGGTIDGREALVVRASLDGVEGIGECAALPAPTYSGEHVAGAADVLRRFLVPALWHKEIEVVGHPMATAALRTALLDARLRRQGASLAGHLGADRRAVPAGAAVGFAPDAASLLAEVARLLALGYGRIKVKVRPGWDVEPLAAVRDLVGPGVLVQADANGAYRLADAGHLARLDRFDLVLLEQPLPASDLLGHAELARRLATPVCLDESIDSADAAALALELGACSVICVKPGRLGGLEEAAAVHDLCRDTGADAWVGGMLETGIGRAGLLGLAALPGFTLPGDLSATGRWYRDDLAEAVGLGAGGTLPVPAGPGIGPLPDPDRLDRFTVGAEVLRRP